MADTVIVKGYNTSTATPGLRNLRVGDDGSIVMIEKYAELAARGKVFHFSNAAFTMPVNANNLVSLFSVYNPVGSGVMMELIEAEIHSVVATTVVNAVGIYALGGQTGATFTTAGTIKSSRLTEGAASAVLAYSSMTFVGTPLLADIVGGYGAVTDSGSSPIYREFDGKIQVPPGVAIAIANTTAASTASGMTALIRWAETPYVAA